MSERLRRQLIGDAERDAVVAELTRHFVAGRLNAEELDLRTGAALAARTQGDLQPALEDLPGPGTHERWLDRPGRKLGLAMPRLV